MSLNVSNASEIKGMSNNNLMELAIKQSYLVQQNSSPLGSLYGKHRIQTDDMTLKMNSTEIPKYDHENNNNNNNNINNSVNQTEVNNGLGLTSERESQSNRQKYTSQDKSEESNSSRGKRQTNENRQYSNGHERHKGDQEDYSEKGKSNNNSHRGNNNHKNVDDLEAGGHGYGNDDNEDEDEMLKIPAEWKKAELHAKSRETKPELEGDEEGGMQEVCQCCGYELERKKVGLNVNVMDLGFLGSGFPLFYNYIKYCCLMLASLFLIEGIPNLVKNLSGSFCNKTDLEVYESYEHNKEHPVNEFIIPCPDNFLNRMSMVNIIDEMDHKTDYNFHYSIAAILTQVALSMVFRRSQRVIEFQVDEENSTPSDFTIMVQNICTELDDVETTLREIFSRYGGITKVNLVYDIEGLEEVENLIQKTIKQKQKALVDNKFDFSAPAVLEMDEKLKSLQHEEHRVKHKIKSTKFVGTAFLSFEEEQQKQDAIEANPQNEYRRFLSYFQHGKSKQYNESVYLKDRHLYISEAPEPNDVDWEFAHVTTEQKIKARISSFIKWALLSIVSFIVICGISYFQSHETEKVLEEQFQMESAASSSSSSSSSSEHSTSSSSSSHSSTSQEDIDLEKTLITALSFAISAIIVIWNKFALPNIIHKICDHEKWSTKTNMNISFAFKLTLGLFFNTALITFFVEVLFLRNIYGFSGGMIYNESLVFIFNAVVPSLAWIIDPWKIIQDCKRSKERKKPISVLTQAEANAIMENPSYSMGKRYADIMKTMWFTFFYSPIMPYGTLISLVGLIAYYITDKYNLLFRRTVKESISSQLSFQMVELVEYSMIFHTFGHVFFKWFMAYYIDVGNAFLFIAVCIIVIILPMHKINELIFPLSSINDPQKYSEVVHTFDTDYDRENPITRKQSLIAFQELRKQKQTENLIQILSNTQYIDGRVQ